MSQVNHAAVLVALALLGTGCAEARMPRPNDAAASDAAVVTDAGAPVDAFSTTDAPRVDSGGDSGAVVSGLAINEIRPSGGDFVEIVNAGTSAVDLGGARIADDEMGAPRLSRAFVFPEGIVLAAGERFVVVCEPTVMMPGLVTGAGCEIAGVTRCIHTDWGISSSSGDTVYLVGSDDSVLASSSYPGMTAAGITADQTWCRLPEGTGAFAPCTPTPEATNAP